MVTPNIANIFLLNIINVLTKVLVIPFSSSHPIIYIMDYLTNTNQVTASGKVHNFQ